MRGLDADVGLRSGTDLNGLFWGRPLPELADALQAQVCGPLHLTLNCIPCGHILFLGPGCCMSWPCAQRVGFLYLYR